MFSAAHFVYIPLCLLAGLALGWYLGARASRNELSRLRQLLEQQEAAAARLRVARQSDNQ